MKKMIGAILAAVILLSAFHPGLFALAVSGPVLEIAGGEGQPGQHVAVTVSIRNSIGFGGMAYDVRFDPTVLKAVSVELGLGSDICVSSGVDTYEDKINFQYAGISNVEGDGVLVTIVFEIIAPEACATDITVVVEEGTAFYYDGRTEIDLTLETAGGLITVLCPHNNTAEVAEIPATCTEGGYTAGVFCDDCQSFVSGHEPISSTGHRYVGGKCENCGETDPDWVRIGDANGDSTVNYLDAMLVAQYYVAEVSADQLNLTAADVNGDGVINYLDAMMIAQYYVGELDSFPAEG